MAAAPALLPVCKIVYRYRHGAGRRVSTVNNEAELFAAISTLEPAKQGTHTVIETYLDVPEVDANFVLQDGKILFYELVDDFLCTSERDDLPGEEDVLQTEMLYPSNRHTARNQPARAWHHGSVHHGIQAGWTGLICNYWQLLTVIWKSTQRGILPAVSADAN